MPKQYIRIEGLHLSIDTDETLLKNKIVTLLGIKSVDLLEYHIVKKSIDSRDKTQIMFVYSVNILLLNNEAFFSYGKKHSSLVTSNIRKHNIRIIEDFEYVIPNISNNKLKQRPIIVGSGPSGLFVALILAKVGMNPIILERGNSVEGRVKDVHNFFTKRELNINSNIQFGEGGAGTFSDGKLYTLINDPRSKFIFEEFVKAGAPEDILYNAKPHIGTDRLRGVVRNIRKKIIELGGEIRFNTMMTDIEPHNGKINAVVLANGEKLYTDDLILAIGHSARETYTMLHKRGLTMQQKPFAMGLRIEHPADMINVSQFGDSCHRTKLGTASYKLVCHQETERSVYSFCMCPGGYVVAASSQEGKLTVNGMSEYKQDAPNSNSALLVNVGVNDFGSTDPLAGIAFQQKWEEAAFIAGGSNYNAPAQLVGDFLKNRPSSSLGSIQASYVPGITLTSLDNCLPSFIINSIRKALPILDKKIKGFARPDALLIGIEARSSSVVRILRDENGESNIHGIYPAGEGAGYAGGITSSAIDGLHIAEKIIEKYT